MLNTPVISAPTITPIRPISATNKVGSRLFNDRVTPVCVTVVGEDMGVTMGIGAGTFMMSIDVLSHIRNGAAIITINNPLILFLEAAFHIHSTQNRVGSTVSLSLSCINVFS